MATTMLIHPFSGSIVSPEHAAETVTPAFELLGPGERAELADRRPRSYLHVIAGEAEDTDPARRAARLERCAAALDRLLAGGVFVHTDRPTAVVYRVDDGPRSHTGLLVDVAVRAPRSGRVRAHEQVRSEKAERFTAHLRAVGASSTPALLIHRPQPRLAAIRDELVGGAPHVDVTAVDESRHRLWIGDDHALVDRLTVLLADIATLYVADGHHRIAAAARVAESAGTAAGDDPHDRFLACLMTTDEVDLLPYHRLVSDVAEDRDGLLAALERRVPIERIDDPRRVDPRVRRRGVVLMRLAGEWIRLDLRAARDTGDDVVFDAELLQVDVLAPVFGIDDPTTDRRLDFVPDDRVDELVRLCDRGTTVGFVLAPATVVDVLAVADEGRTVPPKSTWFRPKLPSGIVLHHLRRGTTGCASRGRPETRSRA